MMFMMMDNAKYGVESNCVITPPSMASPASPNPPSPTHSDSSGSNMPPNSPPGHLRGVPKECGVCSDVAKSMHFGGLSCDSCKAFFRRSVQNNAYKGFSCPYEKKCVIGVSSRKACQYCRFGKCISIGMEKNWVMNEDERRKMMEQRKERKQKMSNRELAQRQHDTSLYALSEEDRKEISSIVNMYKTANTVVPYDEFGSSGEEGERSEESSGNFVLQPWMTFCKRIAYFFSLFKDFRELSNSDQTLLLKTAITSAGIIMGSVVYDAASGKWAGRLNQSRVKNIPNITNKSVEKLVPSDLRTRVDKFFKKFQQICPDETMAMILILVSLYSPELMGLEARDRVQHLQERYIHILQNYIKFKFKERSSIMFPKAIVSLVDIRELADRTWQMRIKERPAGRIGGLSGMGGLGSGLGSPYSSLSFSGTGFHNDTGTSTGYEVVPHTSFRDDPCLGNVVELVRKIQAIFMASPTPLPAIVQLLKNYAMSRYDSKSAKPLISPKKVHRGSKPKLSRGACHRPRKYKREVPLREEFPVTIKEEVMDQSDNDLLGFGSESSVSSTNLTDSPVSPQDLLNSSFSQVQQQPFPQPNLRQQPQHQCSSMYDSLSEYPAHPSDTFMEAPQNPFHKDEHLAAYSHAVSPDEENCSIHQSLMHSPQQPPYIEVTESPPVPQVPSFPSAQRMTSNSVNAGMYKSDFCYSPLAQTPSPQSTSSASSSSSSPEDCSQVERSELFQSLSKSESDVIANILHQVMGVDFDEYALASSLNATHDVNPASFIQVIQEINSTLPSLSAAPLAVTAGVTHNPPVGEICEQVPTSGCSEIENSHLGGHSIPMEYHSMSLGSGIMMNEPHCMGVGMEAMEVDSGTGLNDGT